MFLRTPRLSRSAVAFFNMKHFQAKQKIPLSPEGIKSAFSSQLDPADRLLRQSRVGNGATRVLVLDKFQKVKGVYHPLLCLPHPSVVHGGDSVLGLKIGDYLATLEPQKSDADSPSDPTGLPTVLTALSHPFGIALATYAADGSARMPLKNISNPAADHKAVYPAGLGESAGQLTAPVDNSAFAREVMEVISANYKQYIQRCATLFFVTRDNNASLTLAALQREEKKMQEEQEAAEGSNTLSYDSSLDTPPLFYSDRRWVALPDSVLQVSRDSGLYKRDEATKAKIVSPAGLHACVTRGSLELDRLPRKAVI